MQLCKSCSLIPYFSVQSCTKERSDIPKQNILSTEPSPWRTKYFHGQLTWGVDGLHRYVCYIQVCKRARAKAVGHQVFKTHDFCNSSVWTLKLSTIANPRNARWHGGNATTSAYASQNTPNPTVLPTNYFTQLLTLKQLQIRLYKLKKILNQLQQDILVGLCYHKLQQGGAPTKVAQKNRLKVSKNP